MKRCLAVVVLLILTLLLGVAYAVQDTAELLTNGSFEQLDAQGDADGWYPSAYRSQPGYTRMVITDEKAHTGQHSALVQNFAANDARFTCTVSVQPSSLYRLSGYVLVDSMEDTGNGANFGIEDIYSFSDCLFDTAGEWQYLEWYGETGPYQTEMTFGVRVGGYGSESTGKAYFDDLSLQKVDALPKGIVASVWYETTSKHADNAAEEAMPQKSTWLFCCVGVIFIALYALLRPQLSGKRRAHHLTFALLLAIACVARILLATLVEGYQVDISCFTAWSLRMASVGPGGFYEEGYFCDYPPGYMLMLWPIGILLRFVGLGNEKAVLLLVKALPILFDVLGAVFLYAFALKRIGNRAALVLALLYVFNPAVLVNGAAWGQADSVLAFMLLLTALYAMDQKWHIAVPVFIAAALIKPQALLFAPVGAGWLLMSLINSKQAQRRLQLRSIGIGIVIGAVVALVIVLPFTCRRSNGFMWLLGLYGDTLASYPYATLNTANLYYLFGSNWTSLASRPPMALTVFAVCLFACLTAALIVLRIKKTSALGAKHLPLLILNACMTIALVVIRVTNADYSVFGYAMMGYAFAFALICLLSDRDAQGLPFYMALALTGVYLLGVKVHERYLFVALPLLLMGYAATRDRRLLILCIGFSATTFINTAIVLENSILLGSSLGHLNTDTQVLNVVLCICNLLLCGYAYYVGISGLRPSACVEPPVQAVVPASYRRMLFAPTDACMHITRKDIAVMAVVSALYAVLTFCNLGSTVAPQTGWISSSSDEQVVLELDRPQTFSVLYYAGVSYDDFTIAVSDDGVNWSQEYPCKMREGLCYRWQYAVTSTAEGETVSYASQLPQNVLKLSGKYLRVSALNAGLNLWEVIARDAAGNTIPLKVVAHIGANPDLTELARPADALIDEQETCVGEPGWYNGTYFDEIYHARTAYEHLHGERPYETTHPPLGKLIISLGIAVFGMTPFGWRFSGALVGVAMLPALYLLALQLTHRRKVAATAMCAFALDLMHFTQTRIATIDSFPVLFILLSYLCLVRYLQTDTLAMADGETPRLFTKAYWRSLVPLLLGGIFMGLGIASKWIGIYSAIGLALLFFIAVYRQYRVSNIACGIDAQDADLTDAQKARVLAAQDFALKRILVTCGFCVLFFILIPCAIYYLSYIPYLSPTGPVSLERVLLAQTGMLKYHSTPGLGMDHPFQSQWWQWPFILKPIWFSQDTFEPAGYASTIMCLGNPWVFYIGAVAMIAVFVLLVAKYVRIGSTISLRHGDGDLTLLCIVTGFMAQYLPWVLVPRSMYIYHYFASVPFIILATAWIIDRIPQTYERVKVGVIAVYLIGAAAFFVMFFPYASGWLTPVEWMDAMKWFSKLYY